MVIRGTARVTCPACGKQHDGELVQSINTIRDRTFRIISHRTRTITDLARRRLAG